MQNRSRNWFITENNFDIWTFNKALEKIKKNTHNYYSYAIHDKEEDEQIHVHLIVCYENQRTFQQVKNVFPRANVKPLIDLQKSVQYLIHLNHPDKYQYPKYIIMTSNEEKTTSLLDNDYTECFIDSDKDLYEDIFQGLSLEAIILSRKYSLRYLNQRLQVVKLATELYEKKKYQDDKMSHLIDNLYYDNLIPFNSETYKGFFDNVSNDSIYLIKDDEKK